MKKIGNRNEERDAEIIEQSLEENHDFPETTELANNQLLVTIVRYMQCVGQMSEETLTEGCGGCRYRQIGIEQVELEMNDAAILSMDFNDETDE